MGHLGFRVLIIGSQKLTEIEAQPYCEDIGNNWQQKSNDTRYRFLSMYCTIEGRMIQT